MRKAALRPGVLYRVPSGAPRHTVPALLLATSPLWRRDGHTQDVDAVFTPQPDVARPIKLDGPQIGYLMIKPMPLAYGAEAQARTLKTFNALGRRLDGTEVTTAAALDTMRPLLLPWMLATVEDSRDIAEPWNASCTDW